MGRRRLSRALTERGGTLEMVQLWVNLPAEHKSAPAAYQTLLDADIPRVALPGQAGELRVIAGKYQDHKGPAHTFTPIDVWDLCLQRGGETFLRVSEGHTTLLVVLEGSVQVNGDAVVRDAGLVCFERQGDELHLEVNNDARLLLLSGEPLDEPVVGQGPFVMNSVAEIHQAFADFQRGEFGALNA